MKYSLPRTSYFPTILFAIFLLVFHTVSLFGQWQRTNLPPLTSIQSLAANDTIVYASVYGNGIFAYNVHQNQWVQDTVGLTDLFVNTIAITPGMVYAGTLLDGIYQSNNAGKSWQVLPNGSGLTNQSINVIYPYSNLLYAGTNGGVFVSKNQGQNWAKIDSGLVTVSVQSMASVDSLIFAGSNGNGLSLTANWGYTWAASDSNLYSKLPNITCMTSSADTVYLGSSDKGVWSATGYPPVWHQLPTNLPPATSVFCMYANGSNLYIGTNNGVFSSTNAGRSWFSNSIGITDSTVTAITGNGAGVFIGTDSGYVYQLSVVSGIKPINKALLSAISVAPNPFSNHSMVKVHLSETQPIKLTLVNLIGQEIETLASGDYASGDAQFSLKCPTAGVYFLRLQTSTATQTIKVIQSN